MGEVLEGRVQAKISRPLMNPTLAVNACGGSIAVRILGRGGRIVEDRVLGGVR